MKQRDVQKVRAAGFRVLKLDEEKKAIYENTGTGAWKLFYKYETKTEAKVNYKFWMDNPKCIEG